VTVELALAVQYAEPAPELPRWRLRRWVQRSLDLAADSKSGLRSATITLRLVGLDEGRELNRQYRDRDHATNVLTFEYGMDPDGMMAGDIVLCLPVLQREADQQGKTLRRHAAHLTIHGVLHALGYDHHDPATAQAMESMETHILGSFGMPNPYA